MEKSRSEYPPTKYPIVCRQCGQHFLAWRRDQRYCSRACRGRSDTQPPEMRFWRLVDKDGDWDECWVWKGSVTSAGYGTFTLSTSPRVTVQPHRFSWQLAHGPIAAGYYVLHRCDNPLCVRLSHLFIGTHADNMADMARKGRNRQPKGEANAWAKLTDGDVREIRRLLADGGMSQQRIGQRFGIHQTAVSKIKLGQGWKHV